jgi:hypothetical protein
LYGSRAHAPTIITQDLGEGVLFFNGSAAGGVQASDFVTELHSEEEMQAFIASQSDSVLTVVDICLSDAAPCIRVYPAVLALARSFKGYAAFGRVVADQSDAGRELLRDYNVVEVPTFLFFKNGREVDRWAAQMRGAGFRVSALPCRPLPLCCAVACRLSAATASHEDVWAGSGAQTRSLLLLTPHCTRSPLARHYTDLGPPPAAVSQPRTPTRRPSLLPLPPPPQARGQQPRRPHRQDYGGAVALRRRAAAAAGRRAAAAHHPAEGDPQGARLRGHVLPVAAPSARPLRLWALVWGSG